MAENEEILTKEQYNDIPVYYCKHCLSLKIRQVYNSIDYCDQCSNTDVGETDIHTWEKMYENMYGEPYVNKNIKKKEFKLF